MATMFGRFEIQSELSKSETALIYKAMDTETNQVVALKTQSLEPLGDRADSVCGDADRRRARARAISSARISCCSMARARSTASSAPRWSTSRATASPPCWRAKKVSPSGICWILRARFARDGAGAAKGVAHCSLEPAKIMVQWDGMVKILGYGISNMSLIEAESGKGWGG
jgi:serine/threonine protein kinase